MGGQECHTGARMNGGAPKAAPCTPRRARAARRRQESGNLKDLWPRDVPPALPARVLTPSRPFCAPPLERFGNLMSLALPAAMAGVLAWGFMSPDEDVTAASPHQAR